MACFNEVLRVPHRQAELGIIGYGRGVVIIGLLDDASARSENLLSACPHSVRGTDAHGRSLKKSGAIDNLAACHGAAFVFGKLNIGYVLIELVLIHNRADPGFRIKRITNLRRHRAVVHLRNKGIVDSFGHD